MAEAAAAPVLLDVTRLIWRGWRGLPPTGIDRAALAYAAHYRTVAHAVIQRDGFRRVLSAAASAELFDLLLDPPGGVRGRIVRLLARAVASGPGVSLRGALYINPGHTGLDRPGLGRWITRAGVRPVYLIHDLIPLTHPEHCAPAAPARHAARMRRALDTAAGVIVNSADTRDILRNWADAQGLAMPPTLVAWLGVEPAPPPAAAPPLAGPYFVALGTIEGRKNHLMLLELWRTLAERLGAGTPPLVLIGARGWEAGQALAMLDRCPALRGHVIERAGCDDATLDRYLTHARALLFPSFAEGFGLPLAEALARGTPVVASDLAVFREIAGDAPLYREPIDAAGWRSAVLALAEDGPLWRRCRAAARSYRAPTWAEHFAGVDRWLAELTPSAAARAVAAASPAARRTGPAATHWARRTAPDRGRGAFR